MEIRLKECFFIQPNIYYIFRKAGTMIVSDYHIHTRFSGDCSTDLDDLAAAAIQKNLKTICITDHHDFGYIEEDILFELDATGYYKTMQNFSDRYRDKIDIRIGVETGLEPDKSALLHDFVTSCDFDFVIGSSHLINGVDPYYKEYFEGKTEKQAFMEYFESILRNLKSCKDFDVYGHIDYVVRYAPNKDKNYSYQEYGEIIDEILRALLKMDKGIEINTSGYRSGLSEPNPCTAIIKRYRELGGEIITVGSDAHVKEHIGYHFDRVSDILKHCGYCYYTVFKNRKPDFIKLK